MSQDATTNNRKKLRTKLTKVHSTGSFHYCSSSKSRHFCTNFPSAISNTRYRFGIQIVATRTALRQEKKEEKKKSTRFPTHPPSSLSIVRKPTPCERSMPDYSQRCPPPPQRQNVHVNRYTCKTDKSSATAKATPPGRTSRLSTTCTPHPASWPGHRQVFPISQNNRGRTETPKALIHVPRKRFFRRQKTPPPPPSAPPPLHASYYTIKPLSLPHRIGGQTVVDVLRESHSLIVRVRVVGHASGVLVRHKASGHDGVHRKRGGAASGV